jgi:hypothetical protein
MQWPSPSDRFVVTNIIYCKLCDIIVIFFFLPLISAEKEGSKKKTKRGS